MAVLVFITWSKLKTTWMSRSTRVALLAGFEEPSFGAVPPTPVANVPETVARATPVLLLKGKMLPVGLSLQVKVA